MSVFHPLRNLINVLTLAVSVHAAVPLDIGSRRQVFIDGRYVTAADHVRLLVHQPHKAGPPVITPDHPKYSEIKPYASLLYVDGKYRMWYQMVTALHGRFADPGSAGTDKEQHLVWCYLCYAESSDGIHWEKPRLTMARDEPMTEPNIVIGLGAGGYTDSISDAGDVFIDPHATGAEKYALVLRRKDRARQIDQLDLHVSADGIHWRLAHERIMTYASKEHQLDSQNVIFWDRFLSRYVAYVRRGLPQVERRAYLRTIARAESADLTHFPNVETLPVVFKWDSLDPTGPVSKPPGRLSQVDYYTNAVIEYPWAQDAYYMFPSAYYHYDAAWQREFAKGAPTNAGVLDVRFAASRDGKNWHRFDRKAFVRTGFTGEWDSRSLYLVRGLAPGPAPDEIYLYYCGSDQTHGWNRDAHNNRILREAGLAPNGNPSGIGRLVLRRDGFVSVSAAYTGGQFTTPPLVFAGNRLVLNVDTSAGGEVRVEIQDDNGVPLAGFTAEDADVIHSTNSINRIVRWHGRSDLSALAGHVVRLRFVMRDSDLYAFQFKSSQP